MENDHGAEADNKHNLAVNEDHSNSKDIASNVDMSSPAKDSTQVEKEENNGQDNGNREGDEDFLRMVQRMEEAGMAKVKLKFLRKNYKPTLDTTYMPTDAKESLEEFVKNAEASNGQGRKGNEPPKKKMKLTGRNKKRPRDQRAPDSVRVCPARVAERTCTFGDRCRFMHDIEKYLSEKPADLGPSCYIFETLGKCPFGISCRFASQHIGEDFSNKVNEKLVEEASQLNVVLNQIPKHLQATLRKRKYDFSKADSASKLVLQTVNSNNANAQNVKSSLVKDPKEGAPVVPNSNCDISNDDASKKVDTPKTQLSSETTQSGPSQEEPTSVVVENQNVPKDVVVTGASNSPKAQPVTDTIGDVQVIKLRPQEKKKEHHGIHDLLHSSANGDRKRYPLKSRLRDFGGMSIGDVYAVYGSGYAPEFHRFKVDFSNKLYLAPLTTVGNLPFRRVCKQFGVDITCGEMAMCTNILQGQSSEWALLKRHKSEDIFGVQLCGSYPDTMTRCAQLLTEYTDVDFIDINVGCPIDLVFKKGEGSALMGKTTRFEQIVRSMTSVMDIPLTVKMRTGIFDSKNLAHTLVPKLRDWGVSLVTLHGRSREQRYTKRADWDYIRTCAELAKPLPLYGNGDILSYEDANLRREQYGINGLMIARGALIKPWVFTEIKEQRHWDISSGERFDVMKDFVNFGLQHWGSDSQGVETTRKFFLEWQSFLYRYIPVGVLERVPQKINERPPYFFGRNDLETLMASPSCADWVRLSEMLLGPVPAGFTFLPKHKANAYK